MAELFCRAAGVNYVLQELLPQEIIPRQPVVKHIRAGEYSVARRGHKHGRSATAPQELLDGSARPEVSYDCVAIGSFVRPNLNQPPQIFEPRAACDEA